jgi:hypothetical protein
LQNSNKAMEMMSRSYSTELKNFTLWLLAKPSPHKVRYRGFFELFPMYIVFMGFSQNIVQLMDMLAPRLLGELDSIQTYVFDRLAVW